MPLCVCTVRHGRLNYDMAELLQHPGRFCGRSSIVPIDKQRNYISKTFHSISLRTCSTLCIHAIHVVHFLFTCYSSSSLRLLIPSADGMLGTRPTKRLTPRLRLAVPEL